MLQLGDAQGLCPTWYLRDGTKLLGAGVGVGKQKHRQRGGDDGCCWQGVDCECGAGQESSTGAVLQPKEEVPWSLGGAGVLREVLVLDATVQWVVTAPCGTQEEKGEGAMELGPHEGQM